MQDSEGEMSPDILLGLHQKDDATEKEILSSREHRVQHVPNPGTGSSRNHISGLSLDHFPHLFGFQTPRSDFLRPRMEQDALLPQYIHDRGNHSYSSSEESQTTEDSSSLSDEADEEEESFQGYSAPIDHAILPSMSNSGLPNESPPLLDPDIWKLYRDDVVAPPIIFLPAQPFHLPSQDRGSSRVFKQLYQISKFPLSFKFMKSDCVLIRATLEEHGFAEVSGNDWNLCWSSSHVKPHMLQGLNRYQMINHFPRSFEITRKDKLAENMIRMRQIHGTRHFDFIPPTFLLPSEYNQFYTASCKDRHAMWIIKPAASSRGRGIYIATSPSDVPLDEHGIVSKYISNPLLIDGYKFDLRVYVAVTSYHPLRIYLYMDGLARLATEKYTTSKDCSNRMFMHLTNYSVNKKNSCFVQNNDADIDDIGNKWSLLALRRHLKRVGVDDEMLMRGIKDIVVKTILSIEPMVSTALAMAMDSSSLDNNPCFELYGFDILIDDNFRPWLLEVNLSPSLSCESPLDHRIKSEVIADLFNLACIRPFDSKKLRNCSSRREFGRNGRLKRVERSISSYMRERSLELAQYLEARGFRIDDFSREEKSILRRTLIEAERCGGFERIYPSRGTRAYDVFFETVRPINSLIHDVLYGSHVRFPAPRPPPIFQSEMIGGIVAPRFVHRIGSSRDGGDASSVYIAGRAANRHERPMSANTFRRSSNSSSSLSSVSSSRDSLHRASQMRTIFSDDDGFESKVEFDNSSEFNHRYQIGNIKPPVLPNNTHFSPDPKNAEISSKLWNASSLESDRNVALHPQFAVRTVGLYSSHEPQPSRPPSSNRNRFARLAPPTPSKPENDIVKSPSDISSVRSSAPPQYSIPTGINSVPSSLYDLGELRHLSIHREVRKNRNSLINRSQRGQSYDEDADLMNQSVLRQSSMAADPFSDKQPRSYEFHDDGHRISHPQSPYRPPSVVAFQSSDTIASRDGVVAKNLAFSKTSTADTIVSDRMQTLNHRPSRASSFVVRKGVIQSSPESSFPRPRSALEYSRPPPVPGQGSANVPSIRNSLSSLQNALHETIGSSLTERPMSSTSFTRHFHSPSPSNSLLVVPSRNGNRSSYQASR